MLSFLIFFILADDLEIKYICIRTDDQLPKCSVSNAAVLTSINQYSYHFEYVQIEIINTFETVQTIDLTYFQQFRATFYSKDEAYISIKTDNSELQYKGSIALKNIFIVNNENHRESLTLTKSFFKNVKLFYPEYYLTVFSDEISCDEISLCCFSHITTHNFELNFTDNYNKYHEVQVFCMAALLMSKVSFHKILNDATFYDDSDCAVFSSRNLSLKIYGTQTTIANFETTNNTCLTFLIENHTALRQYNFHLCGGTINLFDNSQTLSTSYIQIKVFMESTINIESPNAYPEIYVTSPCTIVAKGKDKAICSIENVNMETIKIETERIMISNLHLIGEIETKDGCQIDVEKLIIERNDMNIPSSATITVTRFLELYGSITGNIKFAPTMQKIIWTPRYGFPSIVSDEIIDFGRKNVTLEVYVSPADLNASNPTEYDKIIGKEMFLACSPKLVNAEFNETFSKDSIPGFTPETSISGFFSKMENNKQCFGMMLRDQPYKKSVHLDYSNFGRTGPEGGVYYINQDTINNDFGWKSPYIKSFTLHVRESMEDTTFIMNNIPSVPIKIIGNNLNELVSIDFGTNYFPSIIIETCTLVPASTKIDASVVDISRSDLRVPGLYIHNAELLRMTIFQVEHVVTKNITELELEHTSRVDTTIENGVVFTNGYPLDAKSVIYKAMHAKMGSQTTYSFRVNGSFRGNPIALSPDRDVEYIVVFDNTGYNQTSVIKPTDSAKLTVRLYPTKDQIFVPIDFSETEVVYLTSILTSVRAQIPILSISKTITIETDDTIIATEVERAILHNNSLLNPGHRFDRQLTTTLKHIEIDPGATAGLSNVALNDVRIGEGGVARLYDVDSTNCTINVTMFKSVPIISPVFIAISPHAVKPPKSINFYYNANIINMTNGTAVPLVGFGSNLIDRSFVYSINLKQVSRSTGHSIGIFDNSEPRVVGNIEFEHQYIVARFEVDAGGQRVPLWLAIVAISACVLAVAGALVTSIACFCPRRKSKKESFSAVTNEQLLYRDEDQSDSF